MQQGEGVEIPIEATGGDAAAREIAKPTAALGSFTRQAQTTAAASNGLRSSFAGLSENTSKMTGLFAQLDQGTGSVTGGFGKLAGAATGLLGVLGSGGAIGVAGGLIAAIGLVSTALSLMNSESDRSIAKFNEQTAAAGKLESTMIRLAEAQMSNSERLRSRYAAAEAAELANARLVGEDPESVEARRQATLASINRSEDVAFGPRRSRGGRAANDNGLNTFLGAAAGRANFGLDEEGDPQSYGLAGLPPMSAQRESISGVRVSSGEVSKSIRQAQQVKDAWTDAAASMGDGFAGVFSALITGGQDAAAAMLAALGDQMVAEGSRAIFSGLFQTALGNPMGPTMIAIGGAEVAFGATLGATMSGAQGGSGGGGRPSPGGNSGGGERGDRGPTVINVYALDPTESAGRAMDKASRRLERRRVS